MAVKARQERGFRIVWGQEKDVEDLNLSAYMTRTLAPTVGAKSIIKGRDQGQQKIKDQQNLKGQQAVEASFKLGMKYLEDQIDSWNDPYLVGNYTMAAAAANQSEYIARSRSLLTSLAHREGVATYWNLEANTSPFYGWGNTGRLETTALAVEALAKLQESNPDRGDRAAGQSRPAVPAFASRSLLGLVFHASHRECDRGNDCRHARRR